MPLWFEDWMQTEKGSLIQEPFSCPLISVWSEKPVILCTLMPATATGGAALLQKPTRQTLLQSK